MRAAHVLVVSAIAHAPLVVYVADLARTRPRLRPPVAEVTPGATFAPPARPAPAEVSAPIEVAFLVDEPGPAAQQIPAVTNVRPALAATRSAAAATQGRVSASSGEPGGPGARGTQEPGPGPASSALMRMRGPELALDPTAAERIAAAGGGAARDELRKSGKLEAQPGGRAIVHDRVTTLTVDADGKVHFDDKKDIDPRFKLPIPKIWEVENMRRDLGHELTEWFKDPEAGTRYRPASDLPRHLQASQYACDSWAGTLCDDPLAPQIEQRVRERKKVMGGFLGGPMDITAWLHRKFVGDPYASRKLKLLADTLDERVAMGEAYRADQQARSAELMRRNLERLWARERNPVARRAALFELWDECGEDEAGGRARLVVIGWIRARLPAGSPEAYTVEELAVLATHKTSRATFAPYAD